MHLFYIENNLIAGELRFSEQESRHCVKVLRLKRGDELFLTDGKGNLYKGEMQDNDIKGCQIAVLEQVANYPQLLYKLHIGVAPTKNSDRLEWFIEKAVEIGITEITALACENSEHISVKTDRMQRLMIAAMKQSLRIDLPTFNPSIPFTAFISQTFDHYPQKYIAYCGDLAQNPPLLQKVCRPRQDTLILIGPEGDFSLKEVQQAVSHGFIPISLGKFRLRTETAALLACAAVQCANEKF
ncbi:MAG: 16S rRNA (uracil(1498)-N(3))-methyltransferase [Lentimicrobiaceae bacterium]|nr:16S rRNA (uracil(1498)-N(3))-methyltransferase [Lentimicrobiaceae bacterium]